MRAPGEEEDEGAAAAGEGSEDDVKDFPLFKEDGEEEEAVWDSSSRTLVYSAAPNLRFPRLVFTCVSAEGASYVG